MAEKIYCRYLAQRLNLDGTLNGTEQLDTLDELNDWLTSKHYSNVIIRSNQGCFIYGTYNGDSFTHTEKAPLSELPSFLKGYSRAV